MRKLLLANLGAAVGLGAGAVGVAYAVTHKLKDNQNQSNTTQDVNNIFKQIQNLYTGQAEIKTITDNNYNSLYTFIQQAIAGTVASITTSTDKKLELQKDALLEEINKVKTALDAHKQFDGESFAAVYTALANLNQRLDGIDAIQASFEEKLNILKADNIAAQKDMWAGLDGLKTYVETINTTNTGKFDILNSAVLSIQEKLLQVDELRSMLLSAESDIHSMLDRLAVIETEAEKHNAQNQYDIQALKDAIAALTNVENGLDAKIEFIGNTVDSITSHVNTLISEIDKLKSSQSITDADIVSIKDEIGKLTAIQTTTSSQQAALLQQFNDIKSKMDNIFNQNQLLQDQINYLSDQNTQLYQNFLYLQSAVNNLESMYGTGGTTTVSIRPDENDSRYTIYEKTNSSNGVMRYPSIETPNLQAVKRFAIYIKVTNTTTNTSYITQVIDAYPDYSYKLIGSSTQGFNNEQFLVSVGMDKNINKININGIWVRKSSDTWKTSKDIDNTKVQITNVIATY